MKKMTFSRANHNLNSERKRNITTENSYVDLPRRKLLINLRIYLFIPFLLSIYYILNIVDISNNVSQHLLQLEYK